MTKLKHETLIMCHRKIRWNHESLFFLRALSVRRVYLDQQRDWGTNSVRTE